RPAGLQPCLALPRRAACGRRARAPAPDLVVELWFRPADGARTEWLGVVRPDARGERDPVASDRRLRQAWIARRRRCHPDRGGWARHRSLPEGPERAEAESRARAGSA